MTQQDVLGVGNDDVRLIQLRFENIVFYENVVVHAGLLVAVAVDADAGAASAVTAADEAVAADHHVLGPRSFAPALLYTNVDGVQRRLHDGAVLYENVPGLDEDAAGAVRHDGAAAHPQARHPGSVDAGVFFQMIGKRRVESHLASQIFHVLFDSHDLHGRQHVHGLVVHDLHDVAYFRRVQDQGVGHGFHFKNSGRVVPFHGNHRVIEVVQIGGVVALVREHAVLEIDDAGAVREVRGIRVRAEFLAGQRHHSQALHENVPGLVADDAHAGLAEDSHVLQGYVLALVHEDGRAEVQGVVEDHDEALVALRDLAVHAEGAVGQDFVVPLVIILVGFQAFPDGIPIGDP